MYKDYNKPIDERVKTLNKMTLEENIKMIYSSKAIED